MGENTGYRQFMEMADGGGSGAVAQPTAPVSNAKERDTTIVVFILIMGCLTNSEVVDSCCIYQSTQDA
jgi:hypothetical protein